MAPREAAPTAHPAAHRAAPGSSRGTTLLLVAFALVAGCLPARATTPSGTEGQPPPTVLSAPEPAPADAAGKSGIDPDWLSGAKAWILASEYRFKPRGTDGFSAPNRAHGLRAHVSRRGVEFEPRVASKEPFHLALTLTGFGRAGAVRPVSAGNVSVHESRATIERPRAGVCEWYDNSPRGIEQGFTLDARPAGGGPTGEAILSFRSAGDVRALEGSSPTQIEFSDRDGRVRMSLGSLEARDADGRAVDARFAIGRDRIEIRLADQDATYPITVDPMVTTETWTTIGSGLDHLGWSVATAGDVNGDGYSDVIVGVPQDDQGASDNGSVYLFLGSASGLNAFGPNWQGNLGVDGALSGTQVAPAGDVNGDGYDDFLVAERNGGGGSYGYVFLFLGHANPWTAGGSTIGNWRFQTTGTSLRPAIAGAGDVNGDGLDDIIIGTPAAPVGSDQGRAYLWLGRPGFGTTFTTGTTANADQTISGSVTNGRLGWAVATAGDVNGDGLSDVLIGAPGGGPAGQGETTLLLGSTGSPPLAAGATLTGISVGSKSGYAVATAGDLNADGFSDIIIGFPGASAGTSGCGGFTIGLGKATAPYLTFLGNLFGSVANDSTGSAVATAGDVNGDGYADIVVGSNTYLANPGLFHWSRGRADLYLGGPGGLPSFLPAWSRTGALDGFGDGEMFGSSVGTAGDVNGDGFSDLLIGAWNAGPSNAGRAYLFNGAANLPGAQPAWSNTGTNGTDYFGWSVATAGDVNGDGFSDVLVGMPGYDNGQTDEGRVLMYLGTPAGLQTSPAWTYESNQAGANLGVSVASAGDVNNDGYSDIIVGAHQYSSNGHSLNGAAFVWYGYAFGLHNNGPEWSNSGVSDNAQYGASVASAGDVNGDGYGDIIVGAPLDDGGFTDQGKVYAYYGSQNGLPLGLPGTSNWSATGGQTGAHFGNTVASAGDVDGNGESDIIIGAPTYDTNVGGVNHTDAGQVYVYNGYASGLSPVPARILSGTEDNAQFGCSVAGAGDVNGDAYSDVIIGQIWYTGSGPASQGRALIYAGSPSGIGPTPVWQVTSGQSGAAFGDVVASAGDLNGDGYSDVIVGARFYDQGSGHGAITDGGKVFVYYGGPGGPGTTADWTASINQNYANFGVAASAGDVNGDGFGDLIVGAPGWTAGANFAAGRADVFYGNARGTGLTAGVSRGLNQWPDCTFCFGPVATLGSPGSTNFRLNVTGRTPAGRGNVRMQWQIKGKHVPFDATGIQNGTTFQTGAPGGGSSTVNLNQLAVLAPVGDPSHWRLRIASRNPFFPRSPWMSLPYNGANEADLRSAAVSTVVAVEPTEHARTVSLGPSFPNPSSSGSRVGFTLSRAGQAKLAVLDITGRRVKLIADQTFEAGDHAEQWDGGDEHGRMSPAGIYFFRLEAEGQVLSRATVRIR